MTQGDTHDQEITTYMEKIKKPIIAKINGFCFNQIGVIMAFSSITKLPVGVDVFYGSMKDITTVRDFIERFPKKDIGFIFDRGFSSYGLLDDLREDEIHYIVPLRKNSTLIDLIWMRWKGSFLYRG